MAPNDREFGILSNKVEVLGEEFKAMKEQIRGLDAKIDRRTDDLDEKLERILHKMDSENEVKKALVEVQREMTVKNDKRSRLIEILLAAFLVIFTAVMTMPILFPRFHGF